ncbi:MAG: hypothetical protein RR844_00945 [Clostridium sp.]
MYNNTGCRFGYENYENNYDEELNVGERAGAEYNCCGGNERNQSPTDRLCRTIRNSERISGRIIGEACEDFHKMSCRGNNSNTDLLCRANRAAEAASERILSEACRDFRCGRSNESPTDILCRLNREAERASEGILRETCREYNCNRRNDESTTDILCRLNRQAEIESRRVLRETCSQPYRDEREFGLNDNNEFDGEAWSSDNCQQENQRYGMNQEDRMNQWNQWYRWCQWNQWYQQGCR